MGSSLIISNMKSCLIIFGALLPIAMAMDPLTCDNADLNENLKKITGRELRYFIMKIDDGNDIVVDSTGAREDNYFDNFVKELTIENECRYGLIDLEDVNETAGGDIAKVVLVMWRPDEAKVFDKLKYQAGADLLKEKFAEVADKYQEAIIPDDVTLEILTEKARG